MTEKPEPTASEAALAALEKPGHDLMRANRVLRAAKAEGEPNALATAQSNYSSAASVYRSHASQFDNDRDGGIDRVIAKAAQVVLVERGEGHTETNVLPASMGVRVMKAQTDLANARASQNEAQIDAAEAELEDAHKEHSAMRKAHAEAGLASHFEGLNNAG